MTKEYIERRSYVLFQGDTGHSFSFVRKIYDMFELRSEEHISEEWCRALGGRKGGGFNGFEYILIPITKELIDYSEKMNEIQNKIIEDVNDWAIDKIVSVNSSKANTTNTKVIITIAKSMLEKRGICESHINSFIENLKININEIIDRKQWAWKEVLNSQANSLPF